jgi:P27 family predicted phage terminase small subunit
MPGTSSSGGRNKRTRKEHELAGTYRKDRHGATTSTADPPIGRPTPPKGLKGEARAEWLRMLDRLEASKTLSTVDDAALYRYCQLHARAERLEQQLAELKYPFYNDHFGHPRVHPGFAQLRAHDHTLRGYLMEFGLTPAARTRVHQIGENTPGHEDPFAEFDEPPGQRTH